MQFFEDLKGTGAKALTPEERIELEELRRQVVSLRQRVEMQSDTKETKKAKDSDESSEDSECDQVAELPKLPAPGQAKPKARTSVSAEAFGKYNAKTVYQVKVIQKSDVTKEK